MMSMKYHYERFSIVYDSLYTASEISHKFSIIRIIEIISIFITIAHNCNYILPLGTFPSSSDNPKPTYHD